MHVPHAHTVLRVHVLSARARAGELSRAPRPLQRALPITPSALHATMHTCSAQVQKILDQNGQIKHELVRQLIAEFMGVLLFQIFGGAAPPKDTTAPAANGFALVAIIYAFANISGAHLNPAVSFALMCTGHMKWWKGLLYIIVQVRPGAGAALVVRGACAQLGGKAPRSCRRVAIARQRWEGVCGAAGGGLSCTRPTERRTLSTLQGITPGSTHACWCRSPLLSARRSWAPSLAPSSTRASSPACTCCRRTSRAASRPAASAPRPASTTPPSLAGSCA